MMIEDTSHKVFEQLIPEVSTRFINLPANEIDREVSLILKRVVELLDLDRSTIAEFSADGLVATTTHTFHRPETAPPPPRLPSQAIPWFIAQIRAGRTLVFERLPDDLPQEARQERELVQREGLLSHVCVPLHVDGKVIAALGFSTHRAFRSWTPQVLRSLQLLGDVFANALSRKRSDEALTAAMDQIHLLTDRLRAENLYLREEIGLQSNFGEIIGQSEALKAVLRQIQQVAATDSTVVILGETGVGKELLARAIHAGSPRRDRCMIKVNCAALPATLVEAELFGREKGAYTGALTRQLGRFELADRSTLFLDEVSELPPETQVKLLRVLQDGQFERLGSGTTITAHVRVVAATNRDLLKEVEAGRFRRDLYYRLNVFPIVVPPLCQRQEDIPQLVWAFVKEFSEKMGKPVTSITKHSMDGLQRYPWPGNVRELRNVIERAMIQCRSTQLEIALPDCSTSGQNHPDLNLDEVQRRHIRQVLQLTASRIRGTGGAAELLGVNPTTLESRMEKLGLVRTPHTSD